MKFRHRLLFSMDMLFEKSKNTVMVIILLAVSLFLTTLVAALMEKSGEDLENYKKLYSDDMDLICQLQFNTVGAVLGDGINGFVEEVSKTESVEKLGYFSIHISGVAEIRNNFQMASIVKNAGKDVGRIDPDRNPCSICFVNKDMVDILSPGLSTDELYKLFEGEENKVLVGAAFSDLFPVGSKVHFNASELEVAGYIPENNYWPAEGNASATYSGITDLGYNFVASSKVLETMYGKAPFVNAMYVKLSSADAFLSVSNKIHTIAEKIGGVSVMTLKGMLGSAENEYHKIKGMYSKLLVFMWLITILTAIMAAVISVMMQRRKIGIWFAQGMVPADIISFLGIGQLFKSLIASGAAFLAGYAYLNMAARSYLPAFISASFKYLIVLAVICYALMVAVPVLYLKKQNTIELVKIRD